MSRGDISAGVRRSKHARLRSLELPYHEKASQRGHGRPARRRTSSLSRLATLFLAPPSPITPLLSRRRGPPFWKSPRACALALLRLIWLLGFLVLAVALVVAALIPSYTSPPAHYRVLEDAARRGVQPGRVNANSERVFIAASLYDPTGDLVNGAWGRLVKELVDLLGPENTFVSIFESDSGDEGAAALRKYEEAFPSQHKFVAVEEIELQHPAFVTLPDGTKAVKRIEYLAEARNRALNPLRGPTAPRYDKILYLNDVIFNPVEAAQLLFSTNIQYNGRTSYKAACAQDFKSPFLMYDMLAARDLDGWQLGVPLYPWYTASGTGKSRADVLQQRDAVEVKSCWGGMVAFDASFFQEKPSQGAQVTFRAEQDLFHEYSECCLIHADLMEQPRVSGSNRDASTQIYVNPYVRTAYDETTFSWLWLGRRLERALPLVQRIITHLAGLPYFNARREVQAGDPLEQVLYRRQGLSSKGHWKVQTAPANPGSFCAVVNLMVKRLDRDKQKANWDGVGPDERDEIFRQSVEA